MPAYRTRNLRLSEPFRPRRWNCRRHDTAGVAGENDPPLPPPYGRGMEPERVRTSMFVENDVGTDGSETAAEAVRRASALADAFGADLHVVNAYKPPAIV